MKIFDHAHKLLFFGGLSMVTLSFLLDFYFATDSGGGTPLPEPNALSLLAIAGVAAVAVALIRGRKK